MMDGGAVSITVRTRYIDHSITSNQNTHLCHLSSITDFFRHLRINAIAAKVSVECSRYRPMGDHRRLSKVKLCSQKN